ncbi:GAF domain-containing protein [Dechloromonas sp. HYN0024]|uniref:GAF domain-containing protein n=1 Tax=Dechloromonas sp. HYN0024 TaxID=2231055 RepID=UPI000E42E960|nr:GAF domain-containing protein [Dechloromonas sp. HYN0024]AXS78816.1 GAF domain-containing protein [Dechloromonas sp. HYN0024]
MEHLLNPGIGRPLMSSLELQEGIASLSRGAFFKEAPLDMMLSILTEAAAERSGVERVSIWALNDEHQELVCLDLYEMSARRHSKGESLRASQYPSYFRALHEGRSIAADDAYVHPLTTEFLASYLPQHDVTAKLDMPIHIRGELQGVLCLEQVASRQPWASAHVLFAQAVANLVTLALVEHEANEARRQAQIASEQLKAIFDASRERAVFGGGLALAAGH